MHSSHYNLSYTHSNSHLEVANIDEVKPDECRVQPDISLSDGVASKIAPL